MNRRQILSALFAASIAPKAADGIDALMLCMSEDMRHFERLMLIEDRIIEAENAIKREGAILALPDGRFVQNPWLAVSRQNRRLLIQQMRQMERRA